MQDRPAAEASLELSRPSHLSTRADHPPMDPASRKAIGLGTHSLNL
jgi:hypothetical protein